jgi:hypothetical protein
LVYYLRFRYSSNKGSVRGASNNGGFPGDDINSLQQLADGTANLDVYYSSQFVNNESTSTDGGDDTTSVFSPLEHTPILAGTITGTVYDATVVPTIGNVQVPNRIYKIVIDAKTGRALAHMFPNIKLEVSDIDKYAVTVADIEQLTGINFSPRIPANLKVKETQKTTLKDW